MQKTKKGPKGQRGPKGKINWKKKKDDSRFHALLRNDPQFIARVLAEAIGEKSETIGAGRFAFLAKCYGSRVDTAVLRHLVGLGFLRPHGGKEGVTYLVTDKARKAVRAFGEAGRIKYLISGRLLLNAFFICHCQLRDLLFCCEDH